MSLDLPRTLVRLALSGLLLWSSACTLIRVDSQGAPPRIESGGLIDGYAAVGIPAERRLFHAELFDGRSPGAIAELSIWKLLRLELGLAGFAVGVGPFDLALGVLAYDPRLPDYVERKPEPAECPGCPECTPEDFPELGD